eukprot:8194056-Ditylum_brightwellii.AAC.1
MPTLPDASTCKLVDAGNIGSTIKLITNSTPPVLINSETIPAINKLYPQNSPDGTLFTLPIPNWDTKQSHFNYEQDT